jgi:hypothetical protein
MSTARNMLPPLKPASRDDLQLVLVRDPPFGRICPPRAPEDRRSSTTGARILMDDSDAELHAAIRVGIVAFSCWRRLMRSAPRQRCCARRPSEGDAKMWEGLEQPNDSASP